MSKKQLPPALAWVNERTMSYVAKGEPIAKAMSLAGKEYRQGGMAAQSWQAIGSMGRGSRNALASALSKTRGGSSRKPSSGAGKKKSRSRAPKKKSRSRASKNPLAAALSRIG